jgi:hypothetical protein
LSVLKLCEASLQTICKLFANYVCTFAKRLQII